MGNSKWKIYIINLERAPERRKFMLRQLKKYNIGNFEFINALDGHKVGEEWLHQQVDNDNLVRPLTNTEIACAISHKIALEHFLQSDNDYAVVLEDDVLLTPDFVPIVEESIKYLEDDEAILFSGSLHTKQQFKIAHPINTGTNLIRSVNKIEQIYFAAAYLMPRQVAARHIKSIFPVTDVADSWNYYIRKGSMNDLLLAFPYPVRQEVFQSTRGNKATIYKMINWIIYNKIPGLYQFFSERRQRQEIERMKNAEIVG